MIYVTIVVLSLLSQVHAHTRTASQQKKLSLPKLVVVDDTILNSTNLRQNSMDTFILKNPQDLYILSRWRDHLAHEVENEVLYPPQRD